MATPRKPKWSPLLVKSRPPSLVVDRFCYPVDENDLLLAASVHLSSDDADHRTTADKLATSHREFRDAARAITGAPAD